MNEYVGNIIPIEKAQSEGVGLGIDFESDEPLVCNPNRPDAEACESCQ